jgi:hypothetical protein
MADSVKDNSAEVKHASEQLHSLEHLLDELEKIGAEIPEFLSKSVKNLRIALDAGTDVADSATASSAALAQYTNKVNDSCGDDAENGAPCQAREAHKWLFLNADYVLNWKNDDSVVKNSVRATLQRYVPQKICHYLDLCRPRN